MNDELHYPLLRSFLTSQEKVNREYTKIEMLTLTDVLRETVISRMIDSLEFHQGGTGLDAGCGIGSHLSVLAHAAGKGGDVIGIDHDIDALLCARNRSPHTNPSYIRGDLKRLPFPDRTFEWALSVDCIGMILKDTHSMITELIRVVKPGGMLALAAWTFQLLLSGYPLLEAHLNATPRGIAPFQDGIAPSLHFLRLRGQLEKLGLDDICVRSFLGEINPPRNEIEKKALASLFFMRWGNDPDDLPDKERLLYQSLIDPESNQCIFCRSDYYAWFIYTLFTARVPGE